MEVYSRMNNILERIQQTLSEKHLKVTEMFKVCGLKGSTYYSWIDRDSYPSSEYIKPIADYLGVSPNYLLSGEEDEYYLDPATKEMANMLNDNPGQRVLLDAAKDLPAEDILKVIDFIQQQNKKEGRE